MKTMTFATAILAMAVASTAGQTPAPAPLPVSAAQRAFEAGQYDQALQQIAELRERGEAGLVEAFLAAHAQIRRSQNDAARGEFNQLIASGDETWRRVGESSMAALDQNRDHALAVANEAVGQITERNARAAAEAGGQVPAQDEAARWRDFAAFYQLGLARVRFEDWAGAAEAFDRAAHLNASFAYAYYYAGLAYSRMKRPDQVSLRFDVFLKLAPTAPERAAVMSIMRTIRGN